MTWRRLWAALVWLLSWRFLEQVLPRPLVGYLAAGTGIALVSAVIGTVLSRYALSNVSILYLLVVLPTAIRFGSGPAIFASIAAFLAFDWFFIEPVRTFTVAAPDEWVSLVLFLVVSTVTAQLAGAQRRRSDEARRREREARALHDLGRILSASDALDVALAGVAAHLHAELGLAGCAILLPNDPLRGGRAVVRANVGTPPPAEEQVAAEWMVAPARSASATGPGRRWVRVHDPRRPAFRAAPSRVTFIPLKVAERTVGILRLAAAPGIPEWTDEEARLIEAAADQIALTIERSRLRQEALQAEVLRQTDEARKALLASVSHDLRTPLASVKAAAESLLQPDIPWTEAQRRSYLVAIRQEADHLHRLVEHLLDMSRIEAGRLIPERGWYPLDVVVDDVLARLDAVVVHHPVTVDVPETLPPVPLDPVQIGEVLVNLIENAARYTPPGTEIAITARLAGAAVRLSVADAGPGIPAEALPHVFDTFYRVSGGDRATTKGTGLGLAVARGFVEAHGGTISVQSPPPGRPHGTVFSFTLPLVVDGLLAALPDPELPDPQGVAPAGAGAALAAGASGA